MFHQTYILFFLLIIGHISYGQSIPKGQHSYGYAPTENLLKGNHDIVEEKEMDNGKLLISRKLLESKKTNKKDSLVYYLMYEDTNTKSREILLKGFTYYQPDILDNIFYNKSEQLIGWHFWMYEEAQYIKVYHKTSKGWEYLKKFVFVKYGNPYRSGEVIDYRIINKDFIEYFQFVFREKNDSLYAYEDNQNLFNIYEHTGKKWKKFKRQNKRKIYNIQKLNSNVYHFKFDDKWLKKEIDKIKIGYKIMNKNGLHSFLGPKEMNYDIRFDQLPEDLSKYDNEKGRKVINDFKNRIINDFIVELDSNKIIKTIYYRHKGFVLPKSKRIYQTPENL